MQGLGVGGVVAAGAAGGGLLLGQTMGQVPVESIKWNKEADIVVVGSGTVTLAALVAAKNGAKVIRLEKQNRTGGHTAHSGGGLWIPNNVVEKELGIQDSRDEALTYLRAATEEQSKEETMVAFIDTCNEAIRWIWENTPHTKDKWAPGAAYPDYVALLPGGQKNSIGRWLSARNSGKGLMESLDATCEQLGVETMLETRAMHLTKNPKGRIIGVNAINRGNEINIKARKAVIVGTGGFVWNKEMVQHFQRYPSMANCADPACVGDGLNMFIEVGTKLRNLNSRWGAPGYLIPGGLPGEYPVDASQNRGKPGAIVVNKYGQRIFDESWAYPYVDRAFMEQDMTTPGLPPAWKNIPSFLIVDSEYRKRYPLILAKPTDPDPDWATKALTIRELATKLKIDANGLEKTVVEFNKNAKEGKDPIFHRGEIFWDNITPGDRTRNDLKNPCLAPLETPPFYGVPMYPGTMGGTNGGADFNAKAQVLDPFDRVIPGLYVVGNDGASVMGRSYAGGGATLGSGFTFAYIAALDALKMEPWDKVQN